MDATAIGAVCAAAGVLAGHGGKVLVAWLKRKSPPLVNGDALVRHQQEDAWGLLMREREDYKRKKHALDHRVALLEALLSLHDIPVPPR